MELGNRVVVITGAAGGVGMAAARRFAAEGAMPVLTDTNEAGLRDVAAELGAPFVAGDICSEALVEAVAALARAQYGRIDIWFSNAGFAGRPGAEDIAPTEDWLFAWNLHVMAHVHAARAVLPEMLARGEGYLLQTASAVSLSMLLDKGDYTVSKHAALSLGEWLAANYRSRGVRVSCFCPGAMDTPMLRSSGMSANHPALARALKPAQVADLLVRGIREEKFLMVNDGPIDAVPEYADKGRSYEAWIDTMAAIVSR